MLDDNTDDMIITVSREKIAHEIIKLRQEKAKLQAKPDTHLSNKKNSTVGVYSTQKLSLMGHKATTPVRQRPQGKLQPMEQKRKATDRTVDNILS